MTKPIDAARAFNLLSSALPGDWSGTRPNGAIVEVSYRLAAKRSVLAESWTLGPAVDALTLYHLDGERLIASHFCPLGNQPRLQMIGMTEHRFDFAFFDATGLDEGAAHQHSFWIDIISTDRFERSESYGADCVSEIEQIAYARICSRLSRPSRPERLRPGPETTPRRGR